MNRRQALLTLAGCVLWPAAAQALPVPPKPRRLRLVNAHTGETFDGVYRDQSGPIPRVVDELCVFFRDFHCGAVTRMDVGVFDFLADTIDAVGATRATVLSAYRTPATNAMLARTMFGVAENSQHLYGRALDISLDRGLGNLLLFDGNGWVSFPAAHRPLTVAERLAMQRQLARAEFLARSKLLTLGR